MSNIFGTAAAVAPSADPTMDFINGLSKPAAAASVTPIAGSKASRAPSQFWLNIGVSVPGMGENGEAMFVSLPVGIALDDLKAIEVKGNNPNWVALQQAKNALLALVQSQAAALTPGERKALPRISVEVARASAPSQVADSSNTLAAALAAQFTS